MHNLKARLHVQRNPHEILTPSGIFMEAPACNLGNLCQNIQTTQLLLKNLQKIWLQN